MSAGAQQPQTANVKGRLHAAGDTSFHGYVIELESLSSHEIAGRVEVNFEGEFSAAQVPYGDYMVRVTTYHGDRVAQQLVVINQNPAQIDLRLPDRPGGPSGRTVSAKELRHAPDRKAVAASIAAERFTDAGQFDRAAAELEKAVEISPDYALAHSNLGAQYLRMRRFEDAAAEIRRAIELAGPNPHDLSNLAFAQLSLKQVPEAIESARAALKIRKDTPSAHYMLGLALIRAPETKDEGVTHLKEAAREIESARRILASMGR
jgi:tetratricopeptide (TPR) repeat protein